MLRGLSSLSSFGRSLPAGAWSGVRGSAASRGVMMRGFAVSKEEATQRVLTVVKAFDKVNR